MMCDKETIEDQSGDIDRMLKALLVSANYDEHATATRLAALVGECSIYLKGGETPRQRMDRDHRDVLGLMETLARDRERRDRAEAASVKLRRDLKRAAISLDWAARKMKGRCSGSAVTETTVAAAAAADAAVKEGAANG
jgi:hypothetical protein